MMSSNLKIKSVVIALLLTAQGLFAMNNPKAGPDAERCARELFQAGMSTGKTLNRRLFITSMLLSGGSLAVLGYKRSTWAPSVLVFGEDRSPGNDLAEHIIVLTPVFKVGRVSKVDAEKMWKEMIVSTATFGEVPIYGCSDTSLNSTVPIARYAMMRAKGEKPLALEWLVKIKRIIEDGGQEDYLRRCVQQMEEPNYFVKTFGNTERAAIAQKDFPKYAVWLKNLIDEENVDVQLSITLDGKVDAKLGPKFTDALQGKLEEGVKTLGLDYSGFELVMAGLAREWRIQLEEHNVAPLITAFAGRTEMALRLEPSAEIGDALEQHFRNVTRELAKSELQRVYQIATAQRKDILFYVRKSEVPWYEDIVRELGYPLAIMK